LGAKTYLKDEVRVGRSANDFKFPRTFHGLVELVVRLFGVSSALEDGKGIAIESGIGNERLPGCQNLRRNGSRHRCWVFSAARSGSEANATLKAAPHILRAAADEIRMVFVILSVCEAREECN